MSPRPRNVCIVTGARAEFGLLRPVMDAVRRHKRLRLQVIAAGTHLLPPARTVREVEAAFPVAARVPMQRPGRTGRAADAEALGRGVSGFARAFAELRPDWVVVLGDRIEAFAAAGAASIAGVGLCHIHGGDRAEGIADEAMRHAITKLAHLHAAATEQSARRIIRMGEPAASVHVTGSPAIDGLRHVRPMPDAAARRLGDPRALLLLHPAGVHPGDEARWARKALLIAQAWATPDAPAAEHFRGLLILQPNFDSGRERIAEVWRMAASLGATVLDHLPRPAFLSLLSRLRSRNGVLIGNSSAGLIEAAAIGVATVNLGPRQAGRERAGNVIDVPTLRGLSAERIARAARRLAERRPPIAHPYGPGRAGERIAALLARTDPAPVLRKRNTY